MSLLTPSSSSLDAEKILRRIELTAGMHVAVLGCGARGHFVFPAAKLVGEKGKVYGVDIQKIVLDAMDRRIRQEGVKNVETVWSNLEAYGATKIQAESADVALLFNILFQNSKYDDIMREAGRLVHQRGKIAVLDWKREGGPSFAPPVVHRVPEETVRGIARKFSWEEVDEFDASPYHYVIIFRKI